MDDLDDLLDDLEEVPAKKTYEASSGGYSGFQSSKPKKTEDDEFEDMLDDMLGPDDLPKEKYSKPRKVYTSSKPIDDFGAFEEEHKDTGHDGWGEPSSGFGASSSSSVPKIAKKGDKCYPVVVAGEDIPSGYCANSKHLAVCDKLICLSCSHNVVRFVGKKWKDDVEYLFFRNFIKIPDKLKTKAVFESGYCAYACQCKWISTDTRISLPHGGIKWTCPGH
ncbi:unnamed protein product [Moneuplotes crassus]|uniref:Cilia- and flagella-associated protein 418 n=1 Tax=Euplotes crassus TaxID=5936 RepID=A0AAD1XXH9_EUPCR|nr:unnamed protein product [Moneuplotes crassus]